MHQNQCVQHSVIILALLCQQQHLEEEQMETDRKGKQGRARVGPKGNEQPERQRQVGAVGNLAGRWYAAQTSLKHAV